MDEKRTAVYELLNRLGIAANYVGYEQTAYAVLLCVEQQQRLQLVTKCLYPEVAKHYGTNGKAVERNIRTIISVAWKKNRPLLQQLAQYPLMKRPSSAQFLALLSAKMNRC